jgi:hypothetical protein
MKPHWQLVDRAQWQKNGNLGKSNKCVMKYWLCSFVFSSLSAFTRVCEVISSDSLTEIVTKMHSDPELPIALRAALVYRGLPVVASK